MISEEIAHHHFLLIPDLIKEMIKNHNLYRFCSDFFLTNYIHFYYKVHLLLCFSFKI